jgi:pyruvate ferredoxin oxidoreductase alpha subunit
MDARLVTMDSEHSMLTAAGAAAATGVRTFTATSSQGLVYGMEMLYTVAGWRAPFVLVNVSRALSSPITLEPDHNDVLAARDSGFLQIHAETCQEVLDSVLFAYRIAEHSRVRLPALVNLDGYNLSFTREAVQIPDREKVREFLPRFDDGGQSFRASRPVAQGVAVFGGSLYSFFKYQMQLAAEEALAAHAEASRDFATLFGRRYEEVEGFEVGDADFVLVMIGSFATVGKAAVRELRKKGIRVGLVRLRLVRPFPAGKIRDLLRGKRGVAVIDQNLSVGRGGILYDEVAGALYGDKERPPVLLSFVGGLGGRQFKPQDFLRMVRALEEGRMADRSTLLYSREEEEEVRGLLRIAGKAVSHAEKT